MPYQHGYNLRSSTARDQSSEHHSNNHQQHRLDSHQQQHLDNHQQQHLDTHQYNLRSSTARGQPSEHHLDNHQQQHLDNHQQQRLDSHQQQHLDSHQQQHLNTHQQQHLNTHQHDPGFDYSKSSRSPETRAISSYYDSGQDILHSYEYEHDRRNNHYEYYSHDTPRNRDRNQSLLPDANAPFGYQLDVTGRRYPAPDPNQLWRVKELNGAHTERTTREIENLSGYWSIDPNGTQYFHRTVPIEEMW